MDRPLVSVLMITFNHEDYIREAVESVLAQKTDFEFELVIGEDCSTDQTRHILFEYAERFPNTIHLVLADQNQGWRKNYNETFAQCRGEFIALLEGDDYWIDSRKLQKQADFLRDHHDCALCYTRVRKFDDSGTTPDSFLPNVDVKPIASIRDIVAKQFVQTCSVMFRRSAFDGMPPWFEGLKLGDWPAWILMSQRGQLGFIDEVTAAYRLHPGGIWSGSDPLTMCREIIRMFERLYDHIEPKYRSLVKAALSREYFELSWLLRNEGKDHFAKKAIDKCVNLRPFNPHLSTSRVASMWMRYHAAPLYQLTQSFRRQQPH